MWNLPQITSKSEAFNTPLKYRARLRGFVKDVIRYAASIEADLISIRLHEKSLMGIWTSYEQQSSRTSRIPVLVLNPFETRIIRQTPFSF